MTKRILGLFSLLLFAGSASAIEIDSFDNGFYTNTGGHTTSNANVLTGYSGSVETFRSFYAFDLTSIAGTTVTDVSIRFFAGNGQNAGDDLDKELGLFDFTQTTTAIDALLAGTAGVAGFDDLGAGADYGSTTVTKPSTTNVAMDEVVVVLSAAAVAAMNTVLGGADLRFLVGAALTETLAGTNLLWNGSNQLPAAALVINEGGIPAPATLALLALGLIGVARYRRA